MKPSSILVQDGSETVFILDPERLTLCKYKNYMNYPSERKLAYRAVENAATFFLKNQGLYFLPESHWIAFNPDGRTIPIMQIFHEKIELDPNYDWSDGKDLAEHFAYEIQKWAFRDVRI